MKIKQAASFLVLVISLACAPQATQVTAPPSPQPSPVMVETAEAPSTSIPALAPNIPTVAPVATATPPTPTPTPILTPAPMPKDYTTEEFKRLLDLKGLCESGDGEYEARQLAEVWLEDREKFDYKLLNGLYGKHWDRTDEYSADKRELILGFRYAISEMELVCLSL